MSQIYLNFLSSLLTGLSDAVYGDGSCYKVSKKDREVVKKYTNNTLDTLVKNKYISKADMNCLDGIICKQN